jgi:hypothetical protein
VFALINRDLGVHEYAHECEGGKGRFAILIHRGNWMSDLAGCIAPGKGIGYGRDKYGISRMMVTSSTRATNQLFEYIRDNYIDQLAIVWKSH